MPGPNNKRGILRPATEPGEEEDGAPGAGGRGPGGFGAPGGGGRGGTNLRRLMKSRTIPPSRDSTSRGLDSLAGPSSAC